MFDYSKTAHLFRGRAPREETRRLTPRCFCLWDTEAGEYVVKTQAGYGGGGRGKKAFWNSAGAAKNAGMILIRKDFHALCAVHRQEGKEPPARIGSFDEQKRYEVHEMALRRVDGPEPRYALVEFIISGVWHWALIPEDKIKELPLWINMDNIPAWARIITLSSLRISNPEFE